MRSGRLEIAVLVLAVGCIPAWAARIPCIGGLSGSYPCKNVDLEAHLTLEQMGGTTGELGNDIWGWTDPVTGTEYVIVGMQTGTAFVDISDPEKPVTVGFLPSYVPPYPAHKNARDIKTYRDHAYIVADYGAHDKLPGHGMQVLDLTQLRNIVNPPVVLSETAHYSGFGEAHNLAINEETGFAYVMAGHSPRSVHIVDLSDPVNPQFAGSFWNGYEFHDAQCVIYRGPDSNYYGREICFCASASKFIILDVTDKSNPVQVSRTDYRHPYMRNFIHQGWLRGDHAYIFLTDEGDEREMRGLARMFIVGLADLSNPPMAGIYYHTTKATDHNLFIAGGLIYESHYRAGLRILDIGCGDGVPELKEVGYFDTWPPDDDWNFPWGAWGVYPFFESGVVAVSNVNDGLYLLTPHDLDCADETPPLVTEGEEDLACLWPPDHGTVCFETADFEPEIFDNCDGPLTWRFAGCQSDQPDDAPGLGDGNTTDDCTISSDGGTLCARAERDGGAPKGRRYTVDIIATDACGNESPPTPVGTLYVPHNQGAAACDPGN